MYCNCGNYFFLLFFLLYIVRPCSSPFGSFLLDIIRYLYIMGLHVDFFNVGNLLFSYCSQYVYIVTFFIFLLIYYCQLFYVIYIFTQKLSWRQALFYLQYIYKILYLSGRFSWIVWTPKFNRSLYFKKK